VAGVGLEIQPDLPSITGDSRRLREVFLNLLNNALKYGCDGSSPVIRVGATGEGAQVHFWVEDEGPGIPRELRERAFEIFQRLCPEKEGSGVGLALVRKIVEIHGGRVWIDPDYEDGARFCLAFPQDQIQERLGQVA
ncbi:MAG: HAMP domain-containing histidine kinase, partial [Phycisphaerae bacterium]|nr:HAMP domain-containing histidine kinase [Phycisphaerae bacterium]